MKTKLRQLKTKSLKKTYTYLVIILSKKMMSSLKPTHIIINTSNRTTLPKIILPVKTRFDGRGYAVLPREIIPYFTKNQEVDITFKKYTKELESN